jgi:aspartate 4-decarboxylase
MPKTKRPSSINREKQRELLKLSPFELKDKLMDLASEREREGDLQMLNAGRGNPNWISTTPREAFGTLLQFGLEESRQGEKRPGLGWMPRKAGIADRFALFLKKNAAAPGTDLLSRSLDYGVRTLGFDPDTFVYELAESIIGCMYPVPDRMLRCSERIVHEFLVKEMCGGRESGKFDIFAVEGGTAAMCYIFDSLMLNRLLHRGDTIALGVPTFTPYLEVPHFDRYSFKVVQLDASKELAPDGAHTWQFTDEEIDKLADKKIKAFFLVNPSNPPSVAVRERSLQRLVKLVKTKRPDLIVITDDVYCTFVPGFHSLMADLPRNTIGVYSYSKHFGCTGWRLGVVAIHENNLFDEMIAKLPAKDRDELNHRYLSISLKPEKLKFIDRMVADSRQVALNHTAGLSPPQQVQMDLFSLYALLDPGDAYKELCQSICKKRYDALWKGLGLAPPTDPMRAYYYCEIDLMVWAEKAYGPDFVKFLRKNYECTDVLFRLAEHCGIVLMHGGGFGGPDWSVRVSLANLEDETYGRIGQMLRVVAGRYVEEWKASE